VHVLSTGKGAKILVPASQVVDAEQNESLSDVALTQVPSPTWDGTAWTGAVHLASVDEIRHALITPRLIAPHPNLLPDSITGLEALAMQVLLRSELEQTLNPMKSPIAQRGDAKWKGLPLDEAREADDWCWRATAGLHLWHYQSDPTVLCQLVDSATTPSERAAGAVMCCAFHFEANDPDAALKVLHEALRHDDYSAVNHVWLRAQQARALLEVGRQQEAFDLAMKSQRIQREAPLDVTAAAISGACALTAFKATGWMQGDIANTIQRADNPASWWRTQGMYYGLSAHLAQEFRIWSDNACLRFDRYDDTRRRLLSAASLASYAGDHDGWRGATGELAEHLLVATHNTDDPERVAERLTLLRLSGDSTAISHATRHVVARGPTMAARIAASHVEPSLSTRTTALADLELLTAAGDVLVPAQAELLCTWALDTLVDVNPYLERARPTFVVSYKLFDLLKSMIWVLSDATLHRVIDYLLDQPPIIDDGTAQSLARLVHLIPSSAWLETDRQRAAQRTAQDAPYLREAYLAVAAPAVTESRAEIHRRALAGELIAFDAVPDVQMLATEAADALAKSLCARIDDLIDDAAHGSYAGGGLDSGFALALLGVWHPSVARWDRITALLTAQGVLARQLAGTLGVLSSYGEGLPEGVRSEMRTPISVIRNRAPGQHPLFADDIRSLAAEALAALTDAPSRRHLVRELLHEDADHRASSANIIERHGDDAEAEILLALAGDAAPAVRDAALRGLSKLVAVGRAPEGVVAALSKVLESGGRRTAASVISWLSGPSDLEGVSALLVSSEG